MKLKHVVTPVITAAAVGTVLPWAILAMGNDTTDQLLYYAALVFAIAYFALSLANITTLKGLTMLLTGLFMFVGVVGPAPGCAVFGAVMAIPFAVLS